MNVRPESGYRNLDPTKILETVVLLRDRIEARFPDSGLARLASDLVRVAGEAGSESAWLARPNVWLRSVNAGLILLFVIVLGSIVFNLRVSLELELNRISELLQALDAGLNTLILLGGGILFLFTVEVRLKRRHALKRVHELRSLAHIVDMHQLTKDPESLRRGLPVLPSSPDRPLSGAVLIRYLDYCSEMLSLIGKVAAVYVQQYDDPVVLSGVNQVEDLTTGLSLKIWQKIMIGDRDRAERR